MNKAFINSSRDMVPYIPYRVTSSSYRGTRSGRSPGRKMANGTGADEWVRNRHGVGWSGNRAMVTGSSICNVASMMGWHMRWSRYSIVLTLSS